LLAILIGLILVVCGDKGAKSIVTTVINFIFLITGLFLIYQGVNPLLVTFVLCILCACVILFYQNEVNQKSKVSMLSVLCVFLIL
ncbi:YibE/F family protein, partial [Acinetobacter pittii]|uniref:YibE/F family protein n=1 Tax=Acinetobacter pittii TaxID=48296 RepID=UPI0028137D0F